MGNFVWLWFCLVRNLSVRHENDLTLTSHSSTPAKYKGKLRLPSVLNGKDSMLHQACIVYTNYHFIRDVCCMLHACSMNIAQG